MNKPDTSDFRVDTRTLNVRVYGQLRQILLQGRLKAGEPITIRGMAQVLGTSETPVREAMIRLAAERMVIQMPNRSYQVPSLEQSEFRELIEIRIRIEGFAARRAVQNADEKLIDRLTRYNSEMTKNLKDENFQDVLRNNQEFHFALYEGARSPVLMELIEVLWMRSGPYLADAVLNFDDSKDFFLGAGQIHERIIGALETLDEASAERTLEEDLIETARWYEEHAGLSAADEDESSTALVDS